MYPHTRVSSCPGLISVAQEKTINILIKIFRLLNSDQRLKFIYSV